MNAVTIECLESASPEAAERDAQRINDKFQQMMPQLVALQRIAEDAGTREISRVADVVPLLFPHTTYKSYPLAWLDDARFVPLTRWLQSLTNVDLSAVNGEGIETVDGWIEALDEATPLRLAHSFGTSGKLSFFPRSRAEWESGGRAVCRTLQTWRPDDWSVDLTRQSMPLIQPNHSHGASAVIRGVSSLVSLMPDGERKVVYLYPESRYSADIASFAGRLKAARSSSDATLPGILPQAMQRYEAHLLSAARREQMCGEFLERVAAGYAGQNIYMLGLWPVLHDWATAGLKAGIRNLFGSQSMLHVGGGNKGRELPPGWKEDLFEFLGFDRCMEFYAMTEMTQSCPRCECGNYHLPDSLIPLILDARSGALIETGDRRAGRFAFFDTMAESHWGGFVSGDEVILGGAERPCGCGRPGHFLEPDIRRFSLEDGGDDKVSCAGATDSHLAASDYLVEQFRSMRQDQ